MVQKRYPHAAALLPDGNVLVVGGDRYGMNYLDSAERYDPVTNRWSPAGNLEQGRHGLTATCLKDGRVLVVGGYGKSGPLSSAELYDPATN
jgi:Kelch motif